MFLILGLGNPGKEYLGTKHNIGRETAAKFVKKHKLPDFEYDKKSDALVTQGKVGKTKVIVALPETFMNKSGLAAKKMSAAYKLKADNIFVIHDDADLPVGKIKISCNKNAGGHKGVESVIKSLKTKKFWRIRIGISSKRKTKPAMEIVLKKFSAKESEEIKKVQKRVFKALTCAITENPQKAMSLYNG